MDFFKSKLNETINDYKEWLRKKTWFSKEVSKIFLTILQYFWFYSDNETFLKNFFFTDYRLTLKKLLGIFFTTEWW
jgi:hypothetical protein